MRCALRGGIETVGGKVLAAISLSLVAVPLLGQAPPRELKLVGDHWTAWDPPAAIEEGAEVHTIQRGDTLWDLAERFYGNPYLWPQIWERNQYILDAHWIYPGDPLVLGIQVESAELLDEPFREGQPDEDTFEGAEEVADAESDIGLFGGRTSFGPLGTPDDIYCSGYLGENREQFPYEIIGSEYEVLGPTLHIRERGSLSATFGAVDAIKVGLTASDIVYLDGGRAGGMVPGDIFTAVQVGSTVRHPERSRLVGRYYAYLGQVRVLSVQEDTAIAEISQSCQPMFIGAMLKPFQREPVPSDRRTPLRPINEPVSSARLQGAPAILHAKDGLFSVGQDHVVFVELGESDDVEPGDVFTVYRRPIGGKPPIVIGEVAILSVHPRSSVAKIIESRYPMYVGDLLEPK